MIADRRVIVIGAGPAGLACASRLVDLGMKPTVLEASPFVGGMARSVELWGHTVDLGPHRFFSSDPVVVDFWHRHVAGDHVMVQRTTRILYDGKLFDYPLRIGNALRNLGPARALAAMTSYVASRARRRRGLDSLEDWITDRFGRVLYETFFRTYTEKLWGIRCSALDADWAAQRIQGLTLWGAIRSALMRNRGNTLKTLVDEFAYPRAGNSVFYERMRQHIEEGGGQVLTSHPVTKVLRGEDGSVTGVTLADGSTADADVVISSMPITLLLKGLDGVPDEVRSAAARLRFRNTILVYLLIDEADLFPDQWLYVHDQSVQHGRITNFRNWSPELIGDPGQSVLCLEFWCFDEDPIWAEDEATLIARASDELTRTGLAIRESVLEGHVIRVPRCYPVYERSYQEPLGIVTDWLDGIEGLAAIGRYGAFKYNNQDHSILMGILAAESIASGRAPRLWHINTDSTYQEGGESEVLNGTRSKAD